MLVDKFELALERDASSAVWELAHEEVHRARNVLISRPAGTEKGIHEFRKSLKGLRALARLVRRGLGREFKPCNLALRDAGRALSDLRDADVMHGALRSLRTEFLGDPEHEALDRIEHQWSLAHDGRAREVLPERIALALEALDRAEKALEFVQLRSYDELRDGLLLSYRSARKRYRELPGADDDVTLHELRKRIKDVRFHLDLLARSAPPVLEPESALADEISELLGRDHDLVVLHARLQAFGLDPDDLLVADRLIENERARLQTHALGSCEHFLREKPAARTARILDYLREFRASPSPFPSSSR